MYYTANLRVRPQSPSERRARERTKRAGARRRAPRRRQPPPRSPRPRPTSHADRRFSRFLRRSRRPDSRGVGAEPSGAAGRALPAVLTSSARLPPASFPSLRVGFVLCVGVAGGIGFVVLVVVAASPVAFLGSLR